MKNESAFYKFSFLYRNTSSFDFLWLSIKQTSKAVAEIDSSSTRLPKSSYGSYGGVSLFFAIIKSFPHKSVVCLAGVARPTQ